MTVNDLVAAMQKARSGSMLGAYMRGLCGVSWEKRGNAADAPWVYEETQSYREAKELATMLLTETKHFSDVELRPLDDEEDE